MGGGGMFRFNYRPRKSNLGRHTAKLTPFIRRIKVLIYRSTVGTYRQRLITTTVLRRPLALRCSAVVKALDQQTCLSGAIAHRHYIEAAGTVVPWQGLVVPFNFTLASELPRSDTGRREIS